MEKVIKSTYMFIRALPSIILFELLYKIIITAIALPSLSILLKLALEVSGIGYITTENILDFLIHPLSLLLIIMILIICSVLSLIEISAIIGGYGLLYSDREIKVFLMLKTGFKTVKKLFGNFNFVLILYVLLILPLTQFTLTSGIFAFVGIPNIQTIYGISSRKILILIGIIMLIITAILSSKIYSIHFFTLTDLKYSDCLKQSKKITQNKKFKTALSLILWTLFITFSFLTVMFIICFITAFSMKGFTEPENAFFISLKVTKKIISLFTAISSLFFTPMLFSYITACFISENKDGVKIKIPVQNKKSPVKIRFFTLTAFVLSLILNYSFFQNISAENITFNAGFLNKTKVTAHRGFSSKAPENTEPAFQYALEIGADFIELDVQLSKDGKVIVFHDKNLSRITGIKEHVRNKTYKELLAIDFGKWFSDDFENTKIMTLDEVLEKFAGKINLNIEIKSSDDEITTAKYTAQLIEKYNCVDTCYITSFSYNVLRTVKKINPNIKTGLISNIMTYIGYPTLKDIDALSLNKRFVSQNLINNLHMNGKRVFIWTVNQKSEAEKFINMGADNIITDKPDMVIKTVSSKGSDSYITYFLARIFNY